MTTIYAIPVLVSRDNRRNLCTGCIGKNLEAYATGLQLCENHNEMLLPCTSFVDDVRIDRIYTFDPDAMFAIAAGTIPDKNPHHA